MANEKQINTRIQNKHDFEVNWLRATNFVPKDGEIIIYNKELDNDLNLLCSLPIGRTKPFPYDRIKIGDGITNVINLPFAAGNQADWLENDTKQPGYINNRTHYYSIGSHITEPITFYSEDMYCGEASASLSAPLEQQTNYWVSYNGKNYLCKTWYNEYNQVGLGHTHVMGSDAGDNHLPFSIYGAPGSK
jgi:hypothetical protein